MPSSKRVTGNFNFWTGASENWQYFDSTSNSLVTVRRGNKDTVFQSANLVVYGNIVGLGGNIYANITGNVVLPSGTDYGILYKAPGGNAAVSDEFTVDEANNAVAMIGNITITGAGKGNLIANNVSSNRVTATFASITSANIGTANIATNGNITAANIRAVAYLNLAGGNVLYGNANVADYLPTYTGNLVSLTGNVTTTANISAGYVLGNGAFLTGIVTSSYSNANVANYLPIYSGNLNSLAGNVTTTANISAGYVLGNGAFLTGIVTSSYSNANVANYLVSYTGNISAGNVSISGALETATANVTGLAVFSSVANLRIPGGNIGQALISDGANGVDFQNISATPGNSPGSFQYNSNGTALYGVDDFVYDTSNIAAPNIRISNLSLNIYQGANSTGSNTMTVAGNIRLQTATIGNAELANSGVLIMGGIDKLYLEDLQGNTYTGQFVVVDGESFNYANAVTLISSGNANQISIGGNSVQPSIAIANSGVTSGTYGNATIVSQIAVGQDGRITSASNTTINLSLTISNTGTTSTLAVPSQTLTIAGTTNRVISTLSAQTYTLSAPQDLHTGALFQVSGLGAGTTAAAGQVTATGNVSGANINGIIRPTSGNTQAGIIFPNDPGGGSGDAAYIKYYATTGENTVLELNASNDSDDNIYLNASGGTDVQNDLRATGNIIAFFSDERLKTRLGNIENALDKIDQLSTFYFEPNDIAVNTYGYTRHRDIGVSAQEVANVVPEIIAEAPIGHGYLTVKYERFAPLIIAAIKELRVEIADIKKKIDQ